MGFGITLKTILRERGMTIKRLAELSGVPLNTLYSITKRDSERIDPVILRQIASALEIDPYSLADFDTASKMLEDRINARDRITTALDQLNDVGMVKAADAVEIIAEVPKYQRTAPQEGGRATPPAREGKDTTPLPDGLQRPQEDEE